MLTLLSWSHSRIVFSPSSVTGALYRLHVWAIHLNVLLLSVPETLLQIWERSCSQSWDIKWILMSALSSAVVYVGGKKRKRGEWESIVVIVYHTKELALVTKQRASNYSTSCCRVDWNVRGKKHITCSQKPAASQTLSNSFAVFGHEPNFYLLHSLRKTLLPVWGRWTKLGIVCSSSQVWRQIVGPLICSEVRNISPNSPDF